MYELFSKSLNEVYLILRRNKKLLSEVEDKLNEKRLRLYGADGEKMRMWLIILKKNFNLN